MTTRRIIAETLGISLTSVKASMWEVCTREDITKKRAEFIAYNVNGNAVYFVKNTRTFFVVWDF